MSFDYLHKLFSRFHSSQDHTPTDTGSRKNDKFKDIEQRAISLLQEYAECHISKDTFGESMDSLSQEFTSLMYDKEGECIVFDENVPAWLNLFLGNHFTRWNKIRLMVKTASSAPQMAKAPDWYKVEELIADEDAKFMNTVRHCLHEHGK